MVQFRLPRHMLMLCLDFGLGKSLLPTKRRQSSLISNATAAATALAASRPNQKPLVADKPVRELSIPAYILLSLARFGFSFPAKCEFAGH